MVLTNLHEFGNRSIVLEDLTLPIICISLTITPSATNPIIPAKTSSHSLRHNQVSDDLLISVTVWATVVGISHHNAAEASISMILCHQFRSQQQRHDCLIGLTRNQITKILGFLSTPYFSNLLEQSI